jgi:excisionase family DNA binding protein
MTLIQILESRENALTVQEIAQLLGVSDKHIYEMTADGILPAFYVGRSVRLDPQEVADWLRKKKPFFAKRPTESLSPKHKVLNRTKSRTHRAVCRVLRNAVRHLEAAAAIDASSNEYSSE